MRKCFVVNIEQPGLNIFPVVMSNHVLASCLAEVSSQLRVSDELNNMIRVFPDELVGGFERDFHPSAWLHNFAWAVDIAHKRRAAAAHSLKDSNAICLDRGHAEYVRDLIQLNQGTAGHRVDE